MTKTIDDAAKDYLDNMLKTFGSPQYIDSRKVLRDFKAGANWRHSQFATEAGGWKESIEQVIDRLQSEIKPESYDCDRHYQRELNDIERYAMAGYNARPNNLVDVEKVNQTIKTFFDERPDLQEAAIPYGDLIDQIKSLSK